MHGFARAPGHAELGCDGIPEVGFESARNFSWLVGEGAGMAIFGLPMIE